jgi:hypothetical protein
VAQVHCASIPDYVEIPPVTASRGLGQTCGDVEIFMGRDLRSVDHGHSFATALRIGDCQPEAGISGFYASKLPLKTLLAAED